MQYAFVTVVVNNMEESLKFYTEVLELQVLARFSPGPGTDIAFLKDTAGNKIELITHGGPQAQSTGSQKVSIGFAVDSIEQALSRIKGMGLTITRDLVTTPGGQKFFYIEDPNGVGIELIEGLHF